MRHFFVKNHDAHVLMRLVLMALLVAGFLGCASQTSDKKGADSFSVLEPEGESLSTPVPIKSPSYLKLTELLLSLGYQGIGLELEDDATLEFLYQVFSSPKARNRRIQFIYTGLQLSYDKDQSSLTFGEDNHLARALKFIEKNVPTQK